MSVVTALIAIGTPHPNEDHGFAPLYIIELWEGDAATLVARSLNSGSALSKVRLSSPEQIAAELKDLISGLLPAMTDPEDIGAHSVVAVMPLPGSTLGQRTDCLAVLKGLHGTNLYVFEAVFSRICSAWSGEWQEREVRPTFLEEGTRSPRQN